ncbi:hypothetical protein J437_LFUL009299 [Ladona fulva]|uniref:Uncharacterized protein n=1 Tax=Ladona fulva TaxID=123851 RepID=A0A8K0K562_LADFU|nr:hypothetical protein J437_LFUL009299 [Ladona fulva]
MPTPAALSSLGNAMMPLQGGISGATSGSASQPPSEDRYAALKDLDSLMKSSGTGSASPWAPQPTNPSAFGGGTVFGSPSSSTLSSNTSQNLFPASPPMEASAVPIVSANGTPGFAAGASFTSPSSNPFTGASLAVDPNSPWVPSSVASSGSPAVPLNPFQTTRTSFDNSINQVTWGGIGTAGMGMLANGQHPGVGANGSQTFQSNQPFGVFSGSPLNSTVLPQYPAAKVWPPAGNPFLEKFGTRYGQKGTLVCKVVCWLTRGCVGQSKENRREQALTKIIQATRGLEKLATQFF